MGLGADRGLTQCTNQDLVRDTWSKINRLGDEVCAGLAYISWEAAASNCDATGRKTIAHGLPFTPRAVFVQSMLTGGTSATAISGVDNITATTFTVRFYNVSAAATSRVSWLAFQ